MNQDDVDFNRVDFVDAAAPAPEAAQEDRGRARSRSPSPKRSPSRSRSRSRSPRRSRSRSPARKYGHSRPEPPKAEPSNVLGIFGLHFSTRERDIQDEFGKHGVLEKVALITDRRTGESKGYAFLTFASVEDAQKAKDATQDLQMNGRKVRVDFSTTKKAHDPTPGRYMGAPHQIKSREDSRRSYRSRPYSRRSRSRSRSRSPRRRRYSRSRSRSRSPRRRRYSRSRSRSRDRRSRSRSRDRRSRSRSRSRRRY